MGDVSDYLAQLVCVCGLTLTHTLGVATFVRSLQQLIPDIVIVWVAFGTTDVCIKTQCCLWLQWTDAVKWVNEEAGRESVYCSRGVYWASMGKIWTDLWKNRIFWSPLSPYPEKRSVILSVVSVPSPFPGAIWGQSDCDPHCPLHSWLPGLQRNPLPPRGPAAAGEEPTPTSTSGKIWRDCVSESRKGAAGFPNVQKSFLK